MAKYFNGTEPTKTKKGKTPSVSPDPQQKVGAPVAEEDRVDAQKRLKSSSRR